MIGFAFVYKGIKRAADEMVADVIAASLEIAPQMEGFAKENRKWTDRTGHARQGLEGEAFIEKGGIGCRIYHRVDYAKWLETIQGGKFAILEDTRNQYAGPFFDVIVNRLKSKRRA